ncbi:MAG: hypothetical protein R3C28_22545 [Pirellulaceae bacterium]
MARIHRIGMWWLAALILAVSVGCGGGPIDVNEGLDEDQLAIANLVGQVADMSRSLQELRELYAKDAQPTAAQQRDISKGFYFIKDQQIEVSGTTASFTVVVTGENDSKTEKPWTAVKEGDAWKLKDTPVK